MTECTKCISQDKILFANDVIAALPYPGAAEELLAQYVFGAEPRTGGLGLLGRRGPRPDRANRQDGNISGGNRAAGDAAGLLGRETGPGH